MMGVSLSDVLRGRRCWPAARRAILSRAPGVGFREWSWMCHLRTAFGNRLHPRREEKRDRSGFLAGPQGFEPRSEGL